MNHLFKGGALINIEKDLLAFFRNTDTYVFRMAYYKKGSLNLLRKCLWYSYEN